MNAIVKEIFDLYEKYGACDYIGEPVTQTEHMIQTAMVAEEEGNGDEVVLAAFFHDIGHLLGFRDKSEQMDYLGTMDHDKIGGEYLRKKGFPEKVCKLVENHVQAKRWLVSRTPEYFDNLSDASQKTFVYQGGIMSLKEMIEFEKDPLHKTYLDFRRWEDLGKVVGKEIKPVEYYRKLCMKVLTGLT